MKYNKFIQHFSVDRVARYAIAANQNKAKTMVLYKANIYVSQAFNPLICMLEVALRNNIDAILTDHFKDATWIISQKKGFMNAPVLQYTKKKTGEKIDNRYHLKKVKTAEKSIKNAGRGATHGRIIAEQTFGFWTSLYSPILYKLLKGSIIHVFPNRPATHQRSTIHDKLDQIKMFRNRISHHEPICFNAEGLKDFSEARRMHSLIKEVLEWIDPDMISFMKEIDYVDDTINRMDRKYIKA